MLELWSLLPFEHVLSLLGLAEIQLLLLAVRSRRYIFVRIVQENALKLDNRG